MFQTNDGCLVTRGVRAGQRGSWGSGENTHTHIKHPQHKVAAHFWHKYTQLSGAEEDHSQNTQPHHPTTPSPGYHWHRFSLVHTHHPVTRTLACTKSLGGSVLSMWPVENHYSAVQTKEPGVNFLFERSGFLFAVAPAPMKQTSGEGVWMLFCKNSW